MPASLFAYFMQAIFLKGNAMTLRIGRKDIGNLAIAEQQEWLITNGIGGYGSGTVGGSLSRGYHGYLVAAIKPPIDRRIMLVKLDEALTYRGQQFELSSNRWGQGSISPEGCVNIESFTMEGSVPTWRYTFSDAIIEKRIWMVAGENTVYIAYSVVAAGAPISFNGRAIVDNRVFHNTGDTDYSLHAIQNSNSVTVTSKRDGALPLVMAMEASTASASNDFYSNYELPAESDRGLNNHDTHFHAANFSLTLNKGDTRQFMASANATATLDDNALTARHQLDEALINTWENNRIKTTLKSPDWVKQLVLAANQFVVDRNTPQTPGGKSIIAGYHWFEDWGRDTMISLPGITLTTGRPEIAKPILATFANFIDQGMLPNRFPDGQSEPQYNTIDATLWYFQAIRSYFEATDDDELLTLLFPKLDEIITAHINGTRYNIKIDPNDGLLAGGEVGTQLTWMDAKVGDSVITPRMGKPIEVNALWYNALCAMVLFAKQIGMPFDKYQKMADTTKNSFSKFWNNQKNYCFDVIDGPNGDDPTLRPNQLFAVSLPESLLSSDQQKSIVDICAANLLTSHGLRSLAPSDSEYIGIYSGDQFHRDSAYHQGTVWAWLIGPFIRAHLRVYNDADFALQLLQSLADHQKTAGLGTISEIFDGDAPYYPKGCIAQAWSVAEVLRVYQIIEQLKATKNRTKPASKVKPTQTERALR